MEDPMVDPTAEEVEASTPVELETSESDPLISEDEDQWATETDADADVSATDSLELEELDSASSGMPDEEVAGLMEGEMRLESLETSDGSAETLEGFDPEGSGWAIGGLTRRSGRAADSGG